MFVYHLNIHQGCCFFCIVKLPDGVLLETLSDMEMICYRGLNRTLKLGQTDALLQKNGNQFIGVNLV